MKTRLLSLAALTLSFSINAQTISDFENLSLPTDSFWDGSPNPGTTYFSSGNADFPNTYTGGQYPYWSGGFSYSNMKDSTTAGYTNPYSARTAIGYNNSANYLVGQTGSTIKLTGNAAGRIVEGFYITNSTYAALSMKDGDWVAKKFGGANGTDPDWFKLTVTGWYGGNAIQNSVDFLLADYTSANTSEDYIVKDWRWVDLSSLGNVDSLQFTLTSTDNGQFGMNTPASFCMDNFTTSDLGVNVASISPSNFSVYPNPTVDAVNFYFGSVQSVNINVHDVSGKLLYSEYVNSSFIKLNLESYDAGIYFVELIGSNYVTTHQIIKN